MTAFLFVATRFLGSSQTPMRGRNIHMVFTLILGGCGIPLAEAAAPSPPREIPARPALTAKTVDAWAGMPHGFEPRGKMEDPTGTFWGAFFGSPIMLFLLMLAMGSNIYLAREVAHCTRHPAKLVCGLSVAGPFVVPLAFLLMPLGGGRKKTSPAQPVQEAVPLAVQPEPEPQADHGAAAYYHCSQVKFNRNFFNTELMRFLRMAPSETEWIRVRTKRGEELWACRIASVTEEAVTLVVAAGELWDEKMLRMYEIEDIQIVLNQ